MSRPPPEEGVDEGEIVKVNINARAWSEMIGWHHHPVPNGWGPRMKAPPPASLAENGVGHDARSSSVRPPHRVSDATDDIRMNIASQAGADAIARGPSRSRHR